jgi:hypothetical protein
MKNIFTCILLLLVSFSFSQAFMPEYKQSFSNKIEVTLNDGTIVKGKIVIYGLKRMTIKKENGEKIKVGVTDMKGYRIPAPKSKLLKLLSMASGGASSVKELAKTDFNAVLEADYFVFKRILDKKGRPFITQLINPGFDSKIQVYVDPKAKETGGARLTGGLLGGLAKSYYITKGVGSGALYVEKSKYKKSFSTIFEGCSKMGGQYGDKPKWDEISTHVFYFDQLCD